MAFHSIHIIIIIMIIIIIIIIFSFLCNSWLGAIKIMMDINAESFKECSRIERKNCYISFTSMFPPMLMFVCIENSFIHLMVIKFFFLFETIDNLDGTIPLFDRWIFVFCFILSNQINNEKMDNVLKWWW